MWRFRLGAQTQPDDKLGRVIKEVRTVFLSLLLNFEKKVSTHFMVLHNSLFWSIKGCHDDLVNNEDEVNIRKEKQVNEESMILQVILKKILNKL